MIFAETFSRALIRKGGQFETLVGRQFETQVRRQFETQVRRQFETQVRRQFETQGRRPCARTRFTRDHIKEICGTKIAYALAYILFKNI